MTPTSQDTTKARVSTRPCIRKNVSTIWMERATELPNRNVLLKTDTTAALKDFNAVARFRLTIPSKICFAIPLIDAGLCWLLSRQ